MRKNLPKKNTSCTHSKKGRLRMKKGSVSGSNPAGEKQRRGGLCEKGKALCSTPQKERKKKKKSASLSLKRVCRGRVTGGGG